MRLLLSILVFALSGCAATPTAPSHHALPTPAVQSVSFLAAADPQGTILNLPANGAQPVAVAWNSEPCIGYEVSVCLEDGRCLARCITTNTQLAIQGMTPGAKWLLEIRTFTNSIIYSAPEDISITLP